MNAAALRRWSRFVGGRLLATGLVLAVLVVVTFAIVQLIPGDPARLIAGTSATPEQVAEVRASLHLDEPLPAQFGRYVSGIVTGDLGESFQNGLPVGELIERRLPNTITLAGVAVVVVLSVGIAVGMAVAIGSQRRRRLDPIFGAVAGFVGAVPEYISATLLIMVLALWVPLFPPAGSDSWSGYVLPILAISLAPAAVVARIVNREATVVLNQDYVRAAMAKRLPPRLVYLRHVLPNTVSSALALSGLLLAGLVGGAVIVENVFNLPGLGTAIVGAVQQRDYPVIQGGVLVLGVIACLASLIADVALAVLDPRAAEAGRR